MPIVYLKVFNYCFLYFFCNFCFYTYKKMEHRFFKIDIRIFTKIRNIIAARI